MSDASFEVENRFLLHPQIDNFVTSFKSFYTLYSQTPVPSLVLTESTVYATCAHKYMTYIYMSDI